MAKENENNGDEQLQQGAILDTANLLGGLVSSTTIKEVADARVASYKETNGEEVVKKEEVKKPEPKKPEAKKPEEEIEEEEEQEEEEQEEEEEGKKAEGKEKKPEAKEKKEIDIPANKFGLKIKKEEKKNALDIESFDELPKVLKAKYGQEIKDIKDLPKFLETADKWRADSQSLAKVTKEKEDAIATFANLPEDLLEMVKAHYRGEDYKEAIAKTPKLDFSKPVEKQDVKKLVKAYFPDDFKDEDFDAEDKPKELAIAEKAAIKQYVTDKTTREQRAKEQVDKAANRNAAYSASVISSVESLKNDFPEMTPDVFADIEETLTSGSLLKKFYNNDGTVKKSAAKMLALSLHGEEFIAQLMEVARLRGESEAAEEFVSKAPGKKKASNSKEQEGVRKEVTDRIEDLIPQGIVGKKTF